MIRPAFACVTPTMVALERLGFRVDVDINRDDKLVACRIVGNCFDQVVEAGISEPVIDIGATLIFFEARRRLKANSEPKRILDVYRGIEQELFKTIGMGES